jgi:hypothetical protein
MAVLSLANVLWSLLILFFMIVYFIMLYQVIVDLFHRHDVSGSKKAAWFVFWLVLPIISLISYLYIHGDGIAQRTFDRSAKGRRRWRPTIARPITTAARPPRSSTASGCWTRA